MKYFLRVALVTLLTTQNVQAGLFGKTQPTEEEVLQRRKTEANCSKDHSFALCTVLASEFYVNIKDVDVPESLRVNIDSQGSLTAAVNGIGNAAIGVTQLSGSSPTAGSKVGMGALNVIGGLMMFIGGTDNGMRDRLIAFLPESAAKDEFTAHRIIESEFVSAFVKSVPSATSASYETFPTDDGYFISSYVLHGGICDSAQCVLWSNVWGNLCKNNNCVRPEYKARMIQHGFIGDGKYWAPVKGGNVTLVINPKDRRDFNHPDQVTNYGLEGVPDKLDLMLSVSRNLPEWAGYFLVPTRAQKASMAPMVLQHGKKYLFVKPSQTVTEK